MEVEPANARAPITPLDESSLDVNTSAAQILHLIEGSPKVVDFGCGSGNLARFLTQRGCTVFGVDIDADAAGLAREYCADVLIADLDEASPLKLFPTERFDVALFGGILERLRKPDRLLAEVPRILRPGGYVIASIRNVAHGAIRLAMLKGEFNPPQAGVLESQQHFFTRKSVETLLAEAGFYIEELARTSAPIFDHGNSLLPALAREEVSDVLAAEIESDPEAHTLQFVIKALPAASSAARNLENKRNVEALSERVAELEAQLGAAQTELRERLDSPTREHLEEVQRQLHMALLGPEGVEAVQLQLKQKSDELTSLQEQMTTLTAREESTARREAKLAKENLEATESAAQLQKTLEEREATIATLRAELDVAANTLRQRSTELARVGEREKQLSADHAALLKSIEDLRKEIAEREASLETVRRQLDSTATQLQEQHSHAKQTREDLGGVRRELAAERGRLRRLEQKLSSGQADLLSAKTTIGQQNTAIDALETELEAAQDDVAHALTRFRNAETLRESTEVHRQEVIAENEALRAQYTELKASKNASLQEIDAMQVELDGHKRARDKMEHAWRDAKQQYAEALGELNGLQSKAAELTARCERDEFYLREMRRSKFWRLRNSWFGVKRAFGITTDIP